MAVYIVTGKLGNGKSLVTVARAYEYIRSGRRVASNIELKLANMFGRNARNIEVLRVPDKPTIQDLEAIGRGYTGPYDESKFGALILDECGTWFNSRNWQDKTRKEVNDWFLHARKLGWDVYLIIQDISILDSQAREAIAEHTVFCRRLDNMRVPYIGGILKLLTGYRLTLPKMHHSKVVYGCTPRDIVADTWTYRGTRFYSWYDTTQAFTSNYPHGVHCVLTPWHVYGRYAVELNWGNIMRITKIYWKRFKSPVALTAGLLLGGFLMMLRTAEPSAAMPVQYQVQNIEQAPDTEEGVEPVVSTIVSRLKQLAIVGSMQINNSYVHELADFNGQTVYTTKDLARMGYKVVPKGECRVEITADGEVVPIYCL